MEANELMFNISAFGDEIDDDLATQLDVLAAEDIHHLELRSAWGRNVLDLDAAQLKRAKQLLDEQGFKVSAVGSPIGKSQITQPRAFELERMERAIAACGRTRHGLYPRLLVLPSAERPGHAGTLPRRGAGAHGAAGGARRAGRADAGCTKTSSDIYGDMPERCLDLHASVNSPALRNAFDPANYVLCGVRPMVDAWPLLGAYTSHVHVKDARFADGSIQPAGAGDGDIPGLLAALKAMGYRGFLTLEPHLKHAGQFGGLSGPDGMRVAAQALKQLIG